MDLQLTGKRALVSGSTAGIGFAIASRLAKEGASVIVNGRTQSRVDAAIRALGGGDISGFAGDFSQPQALNQLIERWPELEILVNNAGIFEARPFAEITDEEWNHIWEVNVMSGVRLSRHYLPKMLQRGWGRIIFISSESGIQPPVEMIHYGVTKTAQLAVSRGLAEMTAGTGVTVNSVLPGPTRSEGVEAFVKQLAAQQNTDEATIEKMFFEKARPSSLLKRFETPEEIADMVAFIASPLSSGTNGAAVRVDGGVVRSIL
jgi:NAD(P)-dependent dehydrogenase (short-subunit alcohol dehydrogenase family)